MKRRIPSFALAVALGATSLLGYSLSPISPSAQAALVNADKLMTDRPIAVGETSATIGGHYDNVIGKMNECGVLYGLSASTLTTRVPMTIESPYSKTIENLEKDTTYYYQAYMIVTGIRFLGKVESFTTGAPLLTGTVTTDDAAEISNKSVKFSGTFANLSMMPDECGFEFGLTAGKLTNVVKAPSVSASFSLTAKSGIVQGMTYYYRAYAKAGDQARYGEIKSFKALTTQQMHAGLVITTGGASKIYQDRATLAGSYSGLTVAPEEVGIAYGPSPESLFSRVKAETTATSFQCATLKSATMTANTKWYYKAYVKIDGQIFFGNLESFTTSNEAYVPTCTVATDGMDDLTPTSITLRGSYTGASDPVSAVGFCYGTSPQPTASTAATIGTSFEKTLSGLKAGTTYYVCAFAYVDGVRFYGESLSFTTPELPTHLLTADAAVMGGTVTLTGSYPDSLDNVSEMGFVFCKDAANSGSAFVSYKASIGSTFTRSISLPGVDATYYFRAYAIVDGVKVYGACKTFNPSVSDPFVIEVGEARQISDTKWEVSYSFPGATIQPTSSGVRYGLAAPYFTKTAAATDDPLTKVLTTSSGTKYDYQAFAVVNGVTIYGEIKSFTTPGKTVTPPVDPPVVKVPSLTAQALEVDATNANLTATLKDCEETLQSSGFDYGKAANLSDATHFECSKSIPGMSRGLTSLQPGTTYYYRAFVVTSSGKTYRSEIQSFTTDATLPTVQVVTHDATEIFDEGGTLRATYSGTSSTPIETGFVFGCDADMYYTDFHLSEQSDGKNFSLVLTRIADDTAFWYRAYVVLVEGGPRIYGEIKTFHTLKLGEAPKAEAPKAAPAKTVATGAFTKTAKGGKLSASFAHIENATEIGFEYSQNADMSKPVQDDLPLDGDFSVAVSKAMTHFGFYFRAYVVADGQTYYGEIQQAK